MFTARVEKPSIETPRLLMPHLTKSVAIEVRDPIRSEDLLSDAMGHGELKALWQD
jgi:hypothetical protein